MRRVISLVRPGLLAVVLGCCRHLRPLRISAAPSPGASTTHRADGCRALTVTATNVATNAASTTTTDSDGDYSIPYLNPGAYRV